MAKAPAPQAKAAPAKGAKAKAGETEKVEKREGALPLLPLLVLTVLGAAVGGTFGTQVPPLPQYEVEKQLEEKVHPKPENVIIALAPITTNLANNSRTWIRMEASILMSADVGDKAQALSSRVGEDLVGFLRTITLDQLEGASGFYHLREDLNDRVRLRSEGKVSEILIQALIIE